MRQVSRYIRSYTRLWKLLGMLEAVVYAVGAGGSILLLTSDTLISLLAGSVILILSILFLTPWKITVEKAAGNLDQRLAGTEFSTGLLLRREDELSVIARLQRRKVENWLRNQKIIFPPNHLPRALIIAGILLAAGAGIHWLTTEVPSEEKIPVAILGESSDTSDAPRISSAEVKITHPGYTNKGTISTDNLHIQALEGSRITWNIALTGPADSVLIEVTGREPVLLKQIENNLFTGSWTPDEDALYSVRLVRDSLQAMSDIYPIDLFTDQPPVIRLNEPDTYTSFKWDDAQKAITVRGKATDDYGLAGASIVATVSRGSGESVRFREERIDLPLKLTSGNAGGMTKEILLDSLGMEPGDELYFYVEVSDNRQPGPQTTRTETYFAVLQDTATASFMTGGSMGVDLMPDYFRSQRQIIIDTEKLISEKTSLDKKTFNSRSNELGYDQKLLRLKYGQYLGDEFESGITETGQEQEEGSAEEEHEHEEEEDPLEGYTHDHDHEEEGIPEPSAEKEDPMKSYMHDHGDPEAATLFTQGIRAMLKQAMAEMWDAELYLRLYDPEKSLTYQYSALELIQEIKNQARIYVHRIGFDPPPVKEDRRLTGELKEIESPRQRFDKKNPDLFAGIRSSIKILTAATDGNHPAIQTRGHFIRASEELSREALKSPGSHLNTLTLLRQILAINWEGINWENIARPLRNGLIEAVPPQSRMPDRQWHLPAGRMDSLFQATLERRQRDE